jgi:uncharacterized protein YegL
MFTEKMPTINTSAVTRPKWTNKLQEVLLLRDASGSMEGAKAAEAGQASVALMEELSNPCNKGGFKAAVIDFGTDARLVHDLSPATQLAGGVQPLVADGASTNMTAALQMALEMLQRCELGAELESRRLRPVVIVLTDGRHNAGGSPLAVGGQVKAIADVITVAFGEDADEGLLKSLATSIEHFCRCTDGKELRRFLAAVGATLTASRLAGKNATQALAAVAQQ